MNNTRKTHTAPSTALGDIAELIERDYNGDYEQALAVLKKAVPSPTKATGAPLKPALPQLRLYYAVKCIAQYLDSNGVVNFGYQFEKNDGKIVEVTNNNSIPEAVKLLMRFEKGRLDDFGVAGLNEKQIKDAYHRFKLKVSALIGQLSIESPEITEIELPLFDSGVIHISLIPYTRIMHTPDGYVRV